MRNKFQAALVLSVLAGSCKPDESAATSPDFIASDIEIDFERLPGPDGALWTADDIPMPGCPGNRGCLVTTLSDEFESVGITFVNWHVFFEPRATSAGNNLTNNHTVGVGLDSDQRARAEVRLSVPVYGVTITSFSVGSLRLLLLGAAGERLGSADLPHPNPGCRSGPCPQVHGTIVVDSKVPIGSFRLEPLTAQDGLTRDVHISVDNLTLSTAPR